MTESQWELLRLVADKSNGTVAAAVQAALVDIEDLRRQREQLRATCAATILFHAVDAWDEELRREWLRLTGSADATTRTLCDTARAALAATRDQP